MSLDLVNQQLVEEAWEYINSGELSSTPLEKMLEEDINTNDFEALWHHVIEARHLLSDSEDWEPEVGDVY